MTTIKNKKISKIQILTGILLVLYIIWEKNMQQYIANHASEVLPRYDLYIILPLLVILILVSVWQFIKS